MEALVNFQTMVCDLTGMPIATASLLDEATAAAEAMTLAKRTSGSSSPAFLVDAGCHPQTIEVLRTRAEPLGIEIVVGDVADLLDRTDCFGVLLQYPATDGGVGDWRSFTERAHARKAAVVVAADLLALTLIAPPGDWGADIVVGTTQRFGMPMGNGGPHAAYLACRDEFKRSLPGRLVGVSIDTHGRPAYRLALQTREQHIRREKATSNICTNSGLCALAFTIHMSLLGETGFRRLAALNHAAAVRLAEKLDGVRGARLLNQSFFNEFTLKLPVPAAGVVDALAERGVLAGVPGSRLWPERPDLADLLIVAATETNTEAEMDRFATLLEEVL
jgi:glycine dehydrogenase